MDPHALKATKENLDTTIRHLNRAVRWNTFLVHVNINLNAQLLAAPLTAI
jgi:hypothetical protein